MNSQTQPPSKLKKRIKPKDDTDSDELSDESKQRAEEEAKIMVQQQLQQQAEMARRMKVRLLTNLQAVASQSSANNFQQSMINEYQVSVMSDPSLGTLLVGTHKKTQSYILCSYDQATNCIKEIDLECDDSEAWYTPRSVNFRSVAINNRVYIFQNMTTETKGLVWVLDPLLKRLFNLKLIPTTKKDDPPNQPSSARINYAICECNNRVFFYGGIDEQSQVLGTMDVFDACTYKFSPVKYRGDYSPKARQGATALAIDKFTMVIVGGSYSSAFIDAEPVPVSESVIIFDSDSANWRQLCKNSQQSAAAPWNLVFCSLVKLDQQNVGVIWSDVGIMRVSLLNLFNQTWKHIRTCTSDEICYRFGGAVLPVYNQHLSIAAAEELNKDSNSNEAILTVEDLLIFGGISLVEPAESFNVIQIRFSNSSDAPQLAINQSSVAQEEIKESVQLQKKRKQKKN